MNDGEDDPGVALLGKGIVILAAGALALIHFAGLHGDGAQVAFVIALLALTVAAFS